MFTFTDDNKILIAKHLDKYPSDRSRSALLPILDIAQRQNGGWLSQGALQAVADVLEIPVLKVYEVASFYSMFHLKPVGKYHIQVCGTTPCWLRGAEQVRDACCKHLGVDLKEVTKDGLFSVEEVECLGACVNAPVIQINDDFFEDFDESSAIALIEKCRKDGLPESYSALGRTGSSPFEPSAQEQVSSVSKKKAAPKKVRGDNAAK